MFAEHTLTSWLIIIMEGCMNYAKNMECYCIRNLMTEAHLKKCK